jgi:hypothetical protein
MKYNYMFKEQAIMLILMDGAVLIAVMNTQKKQLMQIVFM